MEPDMIDMMSPYELRQALRKADAEKSVPVVGESVAYLHCRHTFDGPPSEELSFDPEEDAVFENCYSTTRSAISVDPLYVAPTDSISRARLDELLAAEKRMVELQSILRGIDEDAKSAGTIIGFASKVFKRLKSIRVAISASNAEVKPS